MQHYLYNVLSKSTRENPVLLQILIDNTLTIKHTHTIMILVYELGSFLVLFSMLIRGTLCSFDFLV